MIKDKDGIKMSTIRKPQEVRTRNRKDHVAEIEIDSAGSQKIGLKKGRRRE